MNRDVYFTQTITTHGSAAGGKRGPGIGVKPRAAQNVYRQQKAAAEGTGGLTER